MQSPWQAGNGNGERQVKWIRASDNYSKSNNRNGYLISLRPITRKESSSSMIIVSRRNSITDHKNLMTSSDMTQTGQLKEIIYALIELTRPYTVIGNVVSVTSISLLPLRSLSEAMAPMFLLGLLQANISLFLVQLYANGINQIYDVEIDKVNKPYLPMASGIVSREAGIAITSISCLLDLSDIEGDKQFGLDALLAVKLGQQKVFWICISTLMMIYGAAIGTGASLSNFLSKFVMVMGHFVIASIVMHRGVTTDMSSSSRSGLDFYMFVWKLKYAEYFLIPFIR
ncbi:coumarin 8-geranyltransferase 1b, chloroplastic-like [Andrographis paniculata]|uniref:coumarin 8-geranyltransferase 1b, chloroplastic-like n=1 Tax=Andrographis paniculata TaxID=175694 RepID=UPI0021E6EBDB|nr:coumarin 8-geranyltransferase 1b, chloroplastic-like [Andrographis paniculata]